MFERNSGPLTYLTTIFESTQSIGHKKQGEIGISALEVVVAVIQRQGKVLLACRPEGKKHAGLWEFPGGKIEPGESLQQALTREIYEELGIEVIAFNDLMEVHHQYDDYAVWLRVVSVTDFTGVEHGREGQKVAWIGLERLRERDFPEANSAILTRLTTATF